VQRAGEYGGGSDREKSFGAPDVQITPQFALIRPSAQTIFLSAQRGGRAGAGSVKAVAKYRTIWHHLRSDHSAHDFICKRLNDIKIQMIEILDDVTWGCCLISVPAGLNLSLLGDPRARVLPACRPTGGYYIISGPKNQRNLKKMSDTYVLVQRESDKSIFL
jgi:hypothetical protein